MDLSDSNFDLSLVDIQLTGDWVESAKGLPMPRALFGEFWLEGELAILFADTGKGKSALAVQIADSIARGKAIEPFEMTAKAQKVLYLDFELTRKQFEMRYAADAKDGEETLCRHYKFSKKFYRAEIRRNRELPAGFKTLEQYIRAALDPAVRKCGAKVLIIDNLTYLRGPSDTARESLPLMRELIRLKEKLGLSILVIAHTPKRNQSRRITVNDLQGSKVLSNFADSIFAIGQSGIDAGIRYLKQLKARSTEMVYDSAHVPAFELKKRDGNFLSFVFRKFSEEAQHLSSADDRVRRERAEVVAEMSKDGMSQRAIAAELGISAASVNRYLHMAEPWNDRDAYNQDFHQDEAESVPDTRIPDAESEFKADPYAYYLKIFGREADDPGDDDEDEDEDEGDDEESGARNQLSSEDAQAGTNGREEPAGEIQPRARGLPEGVERDKDGRLRKRTAVGWDYCADAVK